MHLDGFFEKVNSIGGKPIYTDVEARAVQSCVNRARHLLIAFAIISFISLTLFCMQFESREMFAFEIILALFILVLRTRYAQIHPVVQRMNEIEDLLGSTWRQIIDLVYFSDVSVQDRLRYKLQKLVSLGVAEMQGTKSSIRYSEAKRFHARMMALEIHKFSKVNDFREIEKMAKIQFSI